MDDTTPPARADRAVTIVAAVYIAAGVVGTIDHATEIVTADAIESIWILSLRILAIAAGVFILRGARWARWVAIGWMALHVGVGAMHSASEALVHLAMLGVITWILLRRRSRT